MPMYFLYIYIFLNLLPGHVYRVHMKGAGNIQIL